MVKRVVDVLIALCLVAIVAFFATGGWELSFAGLHVKADRLSSLLARLAELIALRGALMLGFANTAIVVVSTAVALLLAELALRWLLPPSSQLVDIHRKSEVFGWELVPGASGYGRLGERIVINSDGLRDEEHSLEHPGRFRIAAVGDSFTFGMSVNLDDTYAKQLQAALRTREPSANVLSFGVIAYQLWQITRVIENRVAPYRPDLVLIGFFYDDLIVPTAPAAEFANNPFEAKETSPSRLLNVLHNVYLAIGTRYRHLGGTRYLASIEERRKEISPGAKYELFFRAQAGLLDDETYAAARSDLERIAAWSREHATPVLAALIPDSSQLHDPMRQGANRWLAAELARLGIPFHDLTPLFEVDPDPRTLYLLPQDAHTSPKANRMIAEALAQDPTVLELIQKSGFHGPSTRAASSAPGQAGIVTATTTSGSPAPART